MVIVFLLINKYQNEQDQSKKTKFMIFGMVVVFGWLFFAPHFKTQRLGLEYKGVRVYQRNEFVKSEIINKIEIYEEDSAFDLDPMP